MKMDKTWGAFGYKRELGGGERGHILSLSLSLSPMIGWFELIAITIS